MTAVSCLCVLMNEYAKGFLVLLCGTGEKAVCFSAYRSEWFSVYAVLGSGVLCVFPLNLNPKFLSRSFSSVFIRSSSTVFIPSSLSVSWSFHSRSILFSFSSAAIFCVTS